MVWSVHFHCINTTDANLATGAGLTSGLYAMLFPLYQKKPVQCAALVYGVNETVPTSLIRGL
jgi:hypothetical protein